MGWPCCESGVSPSFSAKIIPHPTRAGVRIPNSLEIESEPAYLPFDSEGNIL